jgi:hypothetical protein
MATFAEVEWRPGGVFPWGGFVTNPPIEPEWVVHFYNRCGTVEQHLLGILLRNSRQ